MSDVIFGGGGFGLTNFGATPFFTTKDIIDAVLRHTGHQSVSSETFRRQVVLDAVNNVYLNICADRHWQWLYQELDINMIEPYEDGTINLTKGSEVVTGNGTAFSSNFINPGNVLLMPTRGERYHIEDVSSPTQITLQGEYAGDDQTAVNYKIVKPIYYLPNDCEHIESLMIYDVGELVPVGTQEFHRKMMMDPTYVGRPAYFTEWVRRSDDGLRAFQVWPSPDTRYSGKLVYQKKILKLEDSESNIPLIPDKYRHVIYYGSLAEFFRFLKDPTLATTADTQFQRSLIAMKNDKQLTDNVMKLLPSRNYKNRYNGKRYRRIIDRSDFAKED